MAVDGASGAAAEATAPNVSATGRPRPPPRRRVGARYSRFVGLMKLVLPALAGVLVLMIIVWPQFKEEPEGFKLAPSKGGLEATGEHKLVNARYAGTDRRDNPFTITAQTLAQRDSDAEMVELRRPTADIFLDAGSWVAVTAPMGTYRKNAQILRLTGGVDLFHDEGYEFHTQVAVVDLAAGIASGDQPVRGHGPFGMLQSSGFRILDGGQRVQFRGRSRLLLTPAQAERTR